LALTLGDIKADLKITNETVYRLIRLGKLKAFKIGNRYRILEEDLKKYKEEAINETMS